MPYLNIVREWKINWAADPKRVELFFHRDTLEPETVEFFVPKRMMKSMSKGNEESNDLQGMYQSCDINKT